jgi:hypothetical protein
VQSSSQQVDSIREVIYEPEFDQQLKQVSPDFFRADEFIQGSEWVLARDPESGSRVSESVWILPSIDIGRDNCKATIFYTFNDHKVWMLAIEVQADN